MTIDPSRGRRIFGAALLVGLAVRAVIFSQTTHLGALIVDEKHYSQLANSLLKGYGFAWDATHPTSMRPPLYPAFLATIWSVTGPGHLQAVRLCQLLLSLATTGLVYQIGRRAVGPVVGRYAAAIYWLYPSLIFYSFMLFTETLFVLLLMAFLLAAIALVQTGRAWTAVSCGLALGLAALTRSVLWPVPIVLCPLLAWLVSGSIQRKLALSGLVLAAYAVVVGPWAVRNTRLQGVVTIVDTMGGLNLRMGNYEYTPNERMWAAVTIEGEKNWSYAFLQEHPGEVLTEGQKDKWAQRKAVEYILANPGITLDRAVIKFSDFWGLEREFAAGGAEGLYRPPWWFILAGSFLIVVAYVAVSILGMAGVWLAAPAWRVHALLLLPVLVLVGIHTTVFGHSRYHLPLMPILGVYASALIADWRNIRWKQHRVAAVGAGMLVLVLTGIWVRQVAFVDAKRVRGLLSSITSR